MVISGSLTTPGRTFCWHYATHRNVDHSLGVMFHERFDIGNGWVIVNLFRFGFQLTLTTIDEIKLAMKEARD